MNLQSKCEFSCQLGRHDGTHRCNKGIAIGWYALGRHEFKPFWFKAGRDDSMAMEQASAMLEQMMKATHTQMTDKWLDVPALPSGMCGPCVACSFVLIIDWLCVDTKQTALITDSLRFLAIASDS